jgi:hypothetical protein
MIAARRVADEFWGCARDRIVRAGGTALAQNERYEVLKSPSGVVARGPDGSMVYLSSEVHLEGALAVISDLEPGAFEVGPHARLYKRLQSSSGPPRTSLIEITVAPPPDWVSSMGKEADLSPLRHVHGGFIGAYEDGSAQGGIDCEESGCAEVVAFLHRAKSDLLSDVDNDLGVRVKEAFSADHLPGTGRIAIQWKSAEAPIGQLLAPFLRGGALGP